MEVVIERLDHQFRGIGYLDGKVIFVPHTLPGDVCEVEITKEKKNYFEGTVVCFKKQSDQRVNPFCPYYSSCGGCDLEHLSYGDTLFYKEKMLKELFLKHFDYQNKIIVQSCSNSKFYRNKLHLKVVEGKIGFYESKTHHLVEVKECKLAKKSINAILKDFSSYQFLKGELYIRSNDNDEIIMDIITDENITILKDFPSRHKIVGILQNHKCIYGESFFFERRNGVLYQVSYDSFFQVNEEMSQKLFCYVRDILKHEKKVLDLYCGVGTLGLQLSKNDVLVTGMEVVPNAILNAIKNAKLNYADHFQFHLGKVEDIIFQIPNQFDAIIVDPPRSGLDGKTKEFILKKAPKKIIYVSCNPMTLIRDLKDFVSVYKLDNVVGFDMFPYTKHVECVCVLRLR